MLLGVRRDSATWVAHRSLVAHEQMRSVDAGRLSSRPRAGGAADAAAGPASEGLRSFVGGTRTAMRTAQDGIFMVRTAEAALATAQSLMQRMREFAVRRGSQVAAGGAYLAVIDGELAALRTEVAQTLQRTAWNFHALLDGSAWTLQVGSSAADTLTVAVPGLGRLRAYVGPGEAPSDLLLEIDEGIVALSAARAYLSATEIKLGFTVRRLRATLDGADAPELRCSPSGPCRCTADPPPGN